MDEACSSNEPFAIDKMNEELAETPSSSSRKPDEDIDLPDYSDSSGDDADMPNGMRIKSDLLPHVNNIIAESEVRRRQSIKKIRLEHGPEVVIDESLLDPDEDPAPEDNVIMKYTNETGIYHPADAMKILRRKEKIAVGSWLLVSSVRGGWSYERVKCYLWQKYQIRSVLSKAQTQRIGLLEYDSYFQAVVKFQSEAELTRIFNDLVQSNLQKKFVFFTFADMPVTYYDSDSDDERPRRNPWKDNPADVLVFITM